MNVFMAGEFPVREQVKHRLFSYWYHKDNMKTINAQRAHGTALFLDSGAFSAFTKNAIIDIDTFIEFILASRKDTFEVIAALDVIGDAEATWDNFQYMRKAVPNVLPTFHYGEPYTFLERMVAETDYLALGGVAQLGGGDALLSWFDHVWHNYLTDARGTPKVKVHGFAVTKLEALKRYPWESVDSTSALMSSAFGGCILLNGSKIIKVIFSDDSPSRHKEGGWHYATLGTAQQIHVDVLLKQYGVTAKQCAEHYQHRLTVNLAAFEKLGDLAPTRFTLRQETLF